MSQVIYSKMFNEGVGFTVAAHDGRCYITSSDLADSVELQDRSVRIQIGHTQNYTIVEMIADDFDVPKIPTTP